MFKSEIIEISKSDGDFMGCLYGLFVCTETGSPVAQSGPELTMELLSLLPLSPKC